MPTTTISALTAWEALDSRGRPTIGCRITLRGGGTGRVVTPSGASTGDFEAIELRDRDDRYDGFGTRNAVANLRGPIAEVLIGMDAADQRSLDAAIGGLDHDHALSSIGGNAALGGSTAALLAVADNGRTPLWQLLDGGHNAPLIPLPMVNIISGGAHAGRAIDIQDILVIPVGSSSFTEGIEWVARVRAATAELLTEQGGWAALVADEGGLSARLESNEAALALVTRGIERSGLAIRDDIAIAVDVAASQLVHNGRIRLRSDDVELSTDEWLDRLVRWTQQYPIVSIEDPLGDDDWAAWRTASERLPGIQLLADDLFATNVSRIDRGVEEHVANSVLIKPNQAGLITRTADAITTSRDAGYATVVSARSGDTEDFWLADLAVGWRAGQIKVGSTMRSERTSKWNRLLELEATLDTNYAGSGSLALAP